MAVKQAAAAAAAAMAYGYDYAMGSNPTLAKAAIAGVTDAADYLSKSMIFPRMGLQFNGYGTYAAGAVGGGLTFSGINYYLAGIEPTNTFLRGAGYALASDLLLTYLDKNFADNKIYSYLGDVTDRISGVGGYAMQSYTPPTL